MNSLLSKFFLCLVLSATLTVHAYEPPTDSELDDLLANPRTADRILQGATGAEGAELLTRIVNRIVNNTSIGPASQRFLIALWTSRFVDILPADQLNDFATSLNATIPADFKTIVFAGLSVGGAGNNSFIDHLKELAGEDEVLLDSITRPEVALTIPVYNLLTSTIATTQTLPPSSNITTPIIIQRGEEPGPTPQPSPTPPPEPIVPEPYDGQQG